MNKKSILALKKNRLQCLKSNGKNVDSPGVVKKLTREIKKLEIEVEQKVLLHHDYVDVK